MTGPASEGKLGTLHDKVATVMTRALDQLEASQDHYDKLMLSEDDEQKPDLAPDINPALLSVMVRFLDANKITCAPEKGNTMSELEERLEAKKQKRRVGNVTHLFDE